MQEVHNTSEDTTTTTIPFPVEEEGTGETRKGLSQGAKLGLAFGAGAAVAALGAATYSLVRKGEEAVEDAAERAAAAAAALEGL